MSRGKYTQRAANRLEVRTRDEQIATYQNAVRRLTAEAKELRDKLDAELEQHRATVRELQARLTEAAAPKVTALETLVARRTQERDDAKRLVAAIRSRWEKGIWRLAEHFGAHHGQEGHLAFEAALQVLGAIDDDGVFLVDATNARRISDKLPAAALRVLAAKQSFGDRNPEWRDK